MARTKEGFVVCSVGGKTVAVASGELCRHFNGMITLNSTGELLFRMLQKRGRAGGTVRCSAKGIRCRAGGGRKRRRPVLKEFGKSRGA